MSFCAAQQQELTWLLTYRDKGENALAWDHRFTPLLKDDLPGTPLPSWENQPVNQAAITFLGGVPGYLEVKKSRYFWASGCPGHACVARAMLWADVQSNILVFVATGDEEDNQERTTREQYHIASSKLYLATLAPITPDRLPDELRGAIIKWLHLEGVMRLTEIKLLTPSGSVAVTTDQLCWTGRCAMTRWD
jgi:hypothetical protein